MLDLILIPTAFEHDLIVSAIRQRFGAKPANSGPAAWMFELCGFGLVAAGIAAAVAINRHQPQRVLLIGIAGSLNDALPLGSACSFDRVTCHGIGVGSSLVDSHRSAGELGWPHCEARGSRSAIGDAIELRSANDSSAQLLSVTTASADESEASWRRQRFPQAVAEDMEGFAVAMACQMADVPLQIVRGISNRAGDRDRARWQVEAALDSAIEFAANRLGVNFCL